MVLSAGSTSIWLMRMFSKFRNGLLSESLKTCLLEKLSLLEKMEILSWWAASKY